MLNWELFQQIFRDILRHKVRTVLAMFGIVWGTVAVVMLLALGDGFYQASKKNMAGISDGALLLFPGKTSLPYQGLPTNRPIQLRANEIVTLNAKLPSVRFSSPILRKSQIVHYQKQQFTAEIMGVSPDYAKLTNYHPTSGGRFINPLDIQHQRAVIFLGIEIKQQLFGNIDAIGKHVLIGNIPFTVIGILKDTTNFGGFQKNAAIIPYTTAIKLWGNRAISEAMVLPWNIAQSQTLQNDLTHYLSSYYRFAENDPSAIHIVNLSEVVEFFTWFFLGIELFLGFCGVLTLGVGGIGVANIMYLIVSERTPEIGLRMALGARDTHILQQFMLEATIIILIGGVIGFLLSAVGITSLQHIQLPSWLGAPQLSPLILISTILILAAVGLIAGYFPARQAANMKPVEALAF